MTGSRIRFLSALLSGGLMVGCATTAVSDGTVYDGVRETTMMVAGLEGGPHVPRLVIALRDPVTRVDARQVIVKTADNHLSCIHPGGCTTGDCQDC